MSSRSRSEFKTIKALKSGENGGCNSGILLVKSRASGKKYIEKRVSRKIISCGLAQREVKAMQLWIDHPNIVRIVGHALKDASRVGYGSIFMQHCELGDVDGLIEQYSKRHERLPDEGFLWKVMLDISVALASLWTGHSASHIRDRVIEGKTTTEMPDTQCTRIIHRDIKPANLFLTEVSLDGKSMHFPRVVLGDLGGSVTLADMHAGRVNVDSQSIFTPEYSPPEAPRYFARSDIYQLALSVQCLARMSTTPDTDRYPPYDPLPSQYQDRDLREVLEECLHPNYERRPYPGDLPLKVFEGYKKWAARHGHGEKLARWAFG